MTVTSNESRVEAAGRAMEVHSRRIRELREEESAALGRGDFIAATEAAKARNVEQGAHEIAVTIVTRGGR